MPTANEILTARRAIAASVLLGAVVLVSFCSMNGKSEEETVFHDSTFHLLHRKPRCFDVADENTVTIIHPEGFIKSPSDRAGFPAVVLDGPDREAGQGSVAAPKLRPDTLPIYSLLDAIRMVESGGNDNCEDGDGGRAIGPFQIHRGYWIDSRIPGDYEDCRDRDYSERVVTAYMKRWCPEAWQSRSPRSVEIIARIHNGGPRGHLKKSTEPYARKVLHILALKP